MIKLFLALILLTQFSFAQISNSVLDVNVLGGALTLSGTSTVSGTVTVSNSSFGISGSLPAGTSAIGSITNTVFGATQSGTWNITSITNPVAVTGTFWQATQPISASTLPLPSGAATSALQTSGNAILSSIDSTLAQPLTVSGELMSSFSPDPSNATTATFQPIQFDARGRVETHSTVLTDEGSFRDSFSGSALDASWTASGSTTVTAGNLTIPSGTAAGTQTVSHVADYGPFVISTKLSISQRIANQTVFVGVRDNLTAPTIRSEFNFTGTDNTQAQCITQTSADAGNTQTTTFTLPKNQVTSTSLEYSIEVTAQQVNFLVGGVVVCTHKDSVQDPYGNYSYVYGLTNAATVTNTNIVVEWANFLNVNRLEVSNVFKGQKLEVDNIQVEDSSHATYRAAVVTLNAANNPTDIFTITGSATKTIRVRKIGIEGTQTTASYANVLVLKRSTANSGGTSTLLTNVPMDSDNAAATATVRSYTANPTLGTLIGNITTKKLVVNTASPGTGAVDNDTVFYFGSEFSKSVVLRGTAEVLSINLNATTLAGNSFNIWVEWTEEDL